MPDDFWKGQVEQKLSSGEGRIADLEKDAAERDKVIVALQVQLASLKTQVGFWAALGGIVGAGVIALVVKAIESGGH